MILCFGNGKLYFLNKNIHDYFPNVSEKSSSKLLIRILINTMVCFIINQIIHENSFPCDVISSCSVFDLFISTQSVM